MDALRVLMARHWLVPTCCATGCWALSDVCCDIAIASADDDDAPAVKATGDAPPRAQRHLDVFGKPRIQLTPEQNAIISATVSLGACAVLVASRWRDEAFWRGVSARTAGIAVAAGGVHFLAYAVELRAFRTASSTVITPLLQLSAVWMTLLRFLQPILASALPHARADAAAPATAAAAAAAAAYARRLLVADPDRRSLLAAGAGLLTGADVDALYVATSAMQPAHLASVALIFVGGFLPAAKGKVSRFAEAAFYQQPAVRCCILGELLICIYNALLHACTYKDAGDAATGASDVEVLQFFALSRLGTFGTCALLVASRRADGFSPDDVRALRRCDRAFVRVAVAGECLSVAGVCIVMFSYARFHEPAVVNAAEGGVQQLFNLAFAVALHSLCGVGRRIEDRKTKLVSFALVAAGLALSVR